MMNVLALSWLLLSLVTAGVWTPESNQQAEEKGDEKPKVVMREGHRVFMVEFEREGVLDAAMKGTHDTFHTAADLAKVTGEGIRHTASQARETVEVAGEQAVHVIKSGADKTKEAVKSTADKASHAVKDKASSLLPGSEKETNRDEMVKEAENKSGSAKEKLSETVGSIKDAAAGAKERVKDTYHEAASRLPKFGEQQLHYGDSRAENAENETFKSVGEYIHEAGGSLKDATHKLSDAGTEKIRDIKDEARENADSVKEKVETIKEGAEKTYDSAKDLAYRAKDSVGFDRVGEDGSDFRIQRALRHAREAAIEKFRQAMDEAYRTSTNGDALRRAGNKFERQIIPVLSQDAKDADANIEAAAIRAGDFVKDAATNLSTGSSKGPRLMAARIKRWTSKESLKVGTRMLHLFAFSTIYGSSIWVNFLAGHVLANAVPRQQFGFIQSKMYPVYFKTMAYGLATSLLAHSALHPWKLDANIQRWQDYNLLFSLALTLLNMLYLEPRATKAMFEKLRIEKEEGRGSDVADIRGHSPNPSHDDEVKYKMARVNRKLKLLHRVSSTVNMLTLMSLTWHLAYLSSYVKS